ncbi:AraC family transcriptional regulator [Lentzea flava]|uniref:AraC family transcriptional regulator n=1 Tax=Lentzea flava TaxID=103732 RepID=A0ABQ2UBH3_9PSEU|nr:AraC family transcriptional regulator [Lentzea flava]MCP2196363.1 Helix-turn-helix domain-containing protein [Lentzea flava]GGU18389.1 AraC family transcriptional regulator [Lentzea flava]
MRTRRSPLHGEPATYRWQPAPGELAVSAMRLEHDAEINGAFEAHSHDFPGLAYFWADGGIVRHGKQVRHVEAGDLFVIAPGDVMGQSNRDDLVGAQGWGVFFTADALGPDTPGAHLAWRTHPLLFPFVRGGAVTALRLKVPPQDRDDWTARIEALHDELTHRRDGYREAVSAHLVLLLVGVSRLAADVVGDLRENAEPLLAEVFDVIERRYQEPLSLREVAAAVRISPGHLTSTVRKRTGRTVQEWITERRMVQARRLLTVTELPIGDIGRQVGFPDAGYFARTFGKLHGMSPTRWRRVNGG